MQKVEAKGRGKSSNSSSRVPTETEDLDDMLSALKTQVVQFTNNSSLLHQCYKLAHTVLSIAGEPDRIELRATENLETFVRTVLYSVLEPRNTFRKADLDSPNVIKKTLQVMQLQHLQIPVSHKDEDKDAFPKKTTLATWVKLLWESLNRDVPPCEVPEKVKFSEWVKVNTGYDSTKEKKKRKEPGSKSSAENPKAPKKRMLIFDVFDKHIDAFITKHQPRLTDMEVKHFQDKFEKLKKPAMNQGKPIHLDESDDEF